MQLTDLEWNTTYTSTILLHDSIVPNTYKVNIKFNSNTDIYRENVRKRVVASRDIKTGETLEKNMVVNKRSDEGMFPSQLDFVYGLPLVKDIKKDPKKIELMLQRR